LVPVWAQNGLKLAFLALKRPPKGPKMSFLGLKRGKKLAFKKSVWEMVFEVWEPEKLGFAVF